MKTLKTALLGLFLFCIMMFIVVYRLGLARLMAVGVIVFFIGAWVISKWLDKKT